uniref:Coactosin-like protein n=1 Tax=Paramormyrops kingsleyae TaxID=1676925 RepID=A0A3B3QGW5_9TELE
MATRVDKEACREAYNLVRDDNSGICWASFKYDGSMIVPGGHGSDYSEFKQQCTDDVRLFGFVRITTGDAMSKRAKFTLITWIGENVSGLQRAKISTDKTLVKEVIQVCSLTHACTHKHTPSFVPDQSLISSPLPSTGLIPPSYCNQ